MELRPQPFEILLRRALEELRRNEAIFDLPAAKFHRPTDGLDLSCSVQGARAASPLGPAAGPQTQLAQNIVLAWLGGARVVELKTVQVDDRLVIPRPCIDARTVGFNVEWSQELRVEQALEEYVAAWMLIRILQEEGVAGGPQAEDPIVFDMSVGYDLAGVGTRKVSDFVRGLQDATPVIDRLRARLTGPLARFRDLDFAPQVSAGITLSTFHGCPAGEIEGIVTTLLRELKTHTIIKLNPTLLGYDAVDGIVRGELGYEHLQLDRQAFDHDLQWDDCVAMVERLDGVARAEGRSLGVKFTNTLVVKNHDAFFPGEPTMYLSGQPLHVLAVNLAARFRERFGGRFPISFSAGIDKRNFHAAVACGLGPITTCTDLLRAGGYGRLPGYLSDLAGQMGKAGVSRRTDWILAARGHGAEAAAEVLPAELAQAVADRLAADGPKDVLALLREAGAEDRYEALVATAATRNLVGYAAEVRADARYALAKNRKPPRKVGSALALFDCISCDKCVPVCPNDANFTLETAALADHPTWEAVVGEGGVEVRPGDPYTIERTHQLANFADFCNECGNCDVFCPEDGGPYVVKPRFFGSEAGYREAASRDGFVLEAVALRPGAIRMRGRIAGAEHTLLHVPGGPDRFEDDAVACEVDPETGEVLSARAFFRAKPGHVLPTWRYLAMRALLQGILAAGATTSVGAGLGVSS